ncbi:hypothetical protein [Flagellimonas lutimaris]|jgi:hypothetical protein|uniref:hypothetical protein n=1 Tax=Flagellimonas TaxID=444459 RepID=UPI000B7527FD|nr:MAG: hypothetical protein CBB72_013770 [Muricauda sp. TMED12]|tara:strand:- start:78474 stop:78767 length:294 start_codon:yes stop_codon:yes gene_type:complete
MTKEERTKMIATSWELHSQVETAYLNHPANKNDDEWLEKQRLLLADMALHLLQTSISPEEMKLDRLQDNLHAILTISDRFIPDADLKRATTNLYKIK